MSAPRTACLSLARAQSSLVEKCPEFSAASFLHFVFLKGFCLGYNKKNSLYKGHRLQDRLFQDGPSLVPTGEEGHAQVCHVRVGSQRRGLKGTPLLFPTWPTKLWEELRGVSLL